jgi:hypothetical protein
MHARITAAERRAIAARLSLRFGAAALAALVVLLTAARAEAAVPTPVLTGTDPESPGLSLTPAVHGSSTGIIKSSFPGFRIRAILAAEGAGRTIYLYPNEDCEGEPFGEGSDEELDHGGITVTVAAETTTFISATQEDELGALSECSKAISYQQVKELPKTEEPPPSGPETGSGPGNGGTTAPPDPPHLRTVPGNTSNNLSPTVTGSAPGASQVKLFAVANCSGTPVAKVSPAQLAAGVPVRVTPNAIAAFSGISVGSGGTASACSAPVYYSEDSTAPHTRITMGPASKTRKKVAIFRFVDTTGNPPGTTFFCRVNGKRWKQCRSPMKIRHLKPRRYTFQVKAVDPAGNQDAKPARRRFKVVRARG